MYLLIIIAFIQLINKQLVKLFDLHFSKSLNFANFSS